MKCQGRTTQPIFLLRIADSNIRAIFQIFINKIENNSYIIWYVFAIDIFLVKSHKDSKVRKKWISEELLHECEMKRMTYDWWYVPALFFKNETKKNMIFLYNWYYLKIKMNGIKTVTRVLVLLQISPSSIFFPSWQ